MLGSHFDLAKEIRAIAAKRDGVGRAPPKAAKVDPAFADFDLRISAFLETVAPILVNESSRQDFGPPRPHDERD